MVHLWHNWNTRENCVNDIRAVSDDTISTDTDAVKRN